MRNGVLTTLAVFLSASGPTMAQPGDNQWAPGDYPPAAGAYPVQAGWQNPGPTRTPATNIWRVPPSRLPEQPPESGNRITVEPLPPPEAPGKPLPTKENASSPATSGAVI